MIINAYNFDLLLKVIEENQETIEVILCEGGVNCDFHFRVIYRKGQGFLEDLMCPEVKISGANCLDYDYKNVFLAVVIHSDNRIDPIAVGRRIELSKEQAHKLKLFDEQVHRVEIKVVENFDNS